MAALLIYLLPAIMDMILPAVFFMAQVAAAEQHASASTVANFITIWAAVYMVCAFLLGRVVNQRNAAGLILLSCTITAGLSVGFAFTQTIRPMYVLMALEGVGMALFFVPFQTFMRQVGEGRQRSISSSVGLYTFSWSIGFAIGPFAAALIWRYAGWRASHMLCAIAAVFVAVLTWRLKHAAQTHPRDLDSWALRETETCAERRSPVIHDGARPDLAWMGWVFSGLGCLAARMIIGLFPTSAAQAGLPKIDQGLTLFLLSAMQAFVGLALGRYGHWMYRPWPILISGLFGAASLCLFAVAKTSAVFYMASVCFGVYSGTFFFYLVYHSLVHPHRSGRYVAINEAAVGLTSLAGPFIGGMLADRWAPRSSYLITAAVVFAGILIQAALHVWYARGPRVGVIRIPSRS